MSGGRRGIRTAGSVPLFKGLLELFSAAVAWGALALGAVAKKGPVESRAVSCQTHE